VPSTVRCGALPCTAALLSRNLFSWRPLEEVAGLALQFGSVLWQRSRAGASATLSGISVTFYAIGACVARDFPGAQIFISRNIGPNGILLCHRSARGWVLLRNWTHGALAFAWLRGSPANGGSHGELQVSGQLMLEGTLLWRLPIYTPDRGRGSPSQGLSVGGSAVPLSFGFVEGMSMWGWQNAAPPRPLPRRWVAIAICAPVTRG